MLLMLMSCALLESLKEGFEEPTYTVRFEDGLNEEADGTDWQERAYPVSVQIWWEGDELTSFNLDALGETVILGGFGGEYTFIVAAVIDDDLRVATHQCEVPFSESSDSCTILDRHGEIGLNCSYTFGSCYGQAWSGSDDVPDTGVSGDTGDTAATE